LATISAAVVVGPKPVVGMAKLLVA